MRRSLADSSWKMPWWSSSFQVSPWRPKNRQVLIWLGILFMLVLFFSQSVHYIYIYTHFRHVHQRQVAFIFSHLNMKYIRRKRCGKICLAPPFFLWHVLHPSSLPKMLVKSKDWHWDLHWQCIFQKLWNPSWCWLASIVEWYINMQMHNPTSSQDGILICQKFITKPMIFHAPMWPKDSHGCTSADASIATGGCFARIPSSGPTCHHEWSNSSWLQVTCLGIYCNIPRIGSKLSKQNILTGFFVEFWNLMPEILAPTTRDALKFGAFLLHRTWKVWWHEAAVMMQRPYRAPMIC